ncbi:enoyl-CoA hydratase/isomerase family protein [soil metagenome]
MSEPTSSSPAPLRITSEGDIAVVTLDRGRVNALDLELLDALSLAFRELSTGDGIVLTGQGSVFSAGVDLRRFLDGGLSYAEAFFTALDATLRAAFTLRMPLVTAVNGHAIAGGCVLAATGDHVLMSGGTMGLPELNVGVPFPVVTVEIMRYRLGPRLASVVHSGVARTAEQALAERIIDSVAAPESLKDVALSECRALNRAPKPTFASIRSSLRAGAVAAMGAAPPPAEVAARWSRPEVIERIERALQR